MKKKVSITVVSIFLLVILALVFCKIQTSDKKDNLVHLSLGEVTHSAFYAPLYVSIENGYFEEEDIKIDLSLVSGANNVVAAVLSNSIDIGFCGPEATIYIYNGGEKDYIQSFAGLTKRDGQFIVSREKIDNFSWDMLKGKEVLGGRVGGMPLMNFQNALKNVGIKKNEVKINTSVDFANLTSAYISDKNVSYVNLFEPNATRLEKLGLGYIVTSIGSKSGEMPYTAFNAKKSFIEKNEEVIKRFTKAIDKGLKFVKENDEKKIASVIINQFPDTSINDLETIVKRYKDADSWLDNPFIEEKIFKNLEDMIIDSGEIKDYVPYNDLINNKYEKGTN